MGKGSQSNTRRYDISDADFIAAFERCQCSGYATAKALGVHRSAVYSRLKTLKKHGLYDADLKRGFRYAGNGKYQPLEVLQVPDLPDQEIDLPSLLEHRKAEFRQRQTYEDAVRLIPVKVRMDGPIGILHMGDPHVDDNGTDIVALERHGELVRKTPGLFAATVGDMTNNWVGRLARLYADQSTTAKQAWTLAEWLVKSMDGHWLYLVGGNHDAWSGAGDPLIWITRQAGALYKASECRMELQFPNGKTCRVNARHDFAGGSMWNPAHAPMKALTMGVRDHVAICGHKHESAMGVLKCPATGIVMHAIRVASYKVFDRFAMEKGFRDQNISPCAVTVIDPNLPEQHPDFVKVWWDPAPAVEWLNWKRRKFK
jgi:biotin operon repressor